MKAASILESITVPSEVTHPAEPPQNSRQSSQTFKESLLALSRPSSDKGNAHDAGNKPGRRQSSPWDVTKPPVAVPHVHELLSSALTQQTGQQQVSPDQQPLLTRMTLIPIQLPDVGSLPPPVTQPLSDPSQAEATLPATRDLAGTVAEAAANAGSKADPGAVPKPTSSASLSFLLSPVPSAPAGALLRDIQAAKPNIFPTALPPLASAPAQTLSLVSNAVEKSVSSPVPAGLANAIPSASPVTAQRAAQEPLASIPRNSTATVVPHGMPVDALHVPPPPALHSTLNVCAKGEPAQPSDPSSTPQPSPPLGSDPTTSTPPALPGVTVDQLTVLVKPGGAPFASARASLSSTAVANPTATTGTDGKDGNNNAIKQHPQPLEQTQSQTGSQDAASSQDQNQAVPSQPGQTALPVQTSPANHIAIPIEHAPNIGMTAPLQTPPALAADVTRAPESAAPATLPPPPPVLPVIHTARLLQSMGQSEMRVGMRSSDFGNISISTSATRDLISAQISLDHTELARTLAVHLPELQARLGNSNQAMDVRIDLNGQATGQGNGTSAGTPNGTAEGSHGDRQQRGSASSSQAVHSFLGQATASAATVQEGRLDARLDITA